MAELYTDRENAEDRENNTLLNEKFGAALPLYVIFTPGGVEVARIGGRPSLAEFLAFIRKGLAAGK